MRRPIQRLRIVFFTPSLRSTSRKEGDKAWHKAIKEAVERIEEEGYPNGKEQIEPRKNEIPRGMEEVHKKAHEEKHYKVVGGVEEEGKAFVLARGRRGRERCREAHDKGHPRKHHEIEEGRKRHLGQSAPKEQEEQKAYNIEKQSSKTAALS